MRSAQFGDNLGVYRHLDRSALQANGFGAGAYYNVPIAPEEILRNPVTGTPLQVAVGTIAYSANGEWMVVNMPHQGLLRVKMSDLSVQLFAEPIEPSWYMGLANPALAISNDGRHVAANTDLFGTGNITIYDLTTCSDQLNVAVAADLRYCN